MGPVAMSIKSMKYDKKLKNINFYVLQSGKFIYLLFSDTLPEHHQNVENKRGQHHHIQAIILIPGIPFHTIHH